MIGMGSRFAVLSCICLFSLFTLVCLADEPNQNENPTQTQPQDQNKEEQQVKTEPIVVTVSSQAIPLSESSASMTVLTRDYIANSRTETVAELLRQVPFLNLSQTGGMGGLTTVTIRGGEPNFTLVMVDGIPVNDPTNILGGSFDFSSLSTDNVEQIEIVRGPLSSLYGSEAMSGVINIISRNGAGKPQVSLRGLLGNFDAREAGVGSQGAVDKFRYSLGASYFDIGEQVEKDSYSLGTFAFRSGVQFTKTQALNFTVRLQDKNSAGFPENGGGPIYSLLDIAKDSHARERIIGGNYVHDWKPWWSYQLEVDFYQRLEDSFIPAILDSIPPSFSAQPSIQSNTDFKKTQFQFMNNWKLQNDLSASFGVEVKEEDGKNDSVIAEFLPSSFDLSRTTLSFTGEGLYSSGPFNANFGLRIDDPDDFDVKVSPRVGANYFFENTKTRIRGTWGNGFKLPSFYALGEPNVGNPNLKPETSTGFDLGVDQDLLDGRLQVSLTYFWNHYRDLIDFSAELFKLVNRDLVKDQGAEFEATVPVSNTLHFMGHVSYIDSKIVNSPEKLRDRPKWRGGIGVQWQPFSGSQLQFDTIWVGERADFQLPVPQLNIAPAYNTTDLAFTQKLTRDFSGYVRIENLFNNKYQNFIGFPDPGFFARFGVIYKLGG